FLWKGWYALLSTKELSQSAAGIRRRCDRRDFCRKQQSGGGRPFALCCGPAPAPGLSSSLRYLQNLTRSRAPKPREDRGSKIHGSLHRLLQMQAEIENPVS